MASIGEILYDIHKVGFKADSTATFFKHKWRQSTKKKDETQELIAVAYPLNSTSWMIMTFFSAPRSNLYAQRTAMLNSHHKKLRRVALLLHFILAPYKFCQSKYSKHMQDSFRVDKEAPPQKAESINDQLLHAPTHLV